jgi:hypothetical protein
MRKKHGMMTEHENGLCGEGRIGNAEQRDRTQGMRMTEHRMTVYPLIMKNPRDRMHVLVLHSQFCLPFEL